MSSPEQRRNQLEDRVRELETEVEIWKDRAEINGKKGLEALEHLDQSRALAESRRIQVERLRAQLNSPITDDFVQAVIVEAAHQRERWGTEHDGGKSDADWFWLIGYLAGKALHNPASPELAEAVIAAAAEHKAKETLQAGLQEKQLHRIITVAAAACNWHMAVLGKTNMRPGIAPPEAHA